MTKFQFKMADGRHIENYLKCYNSSTSGAIWTKLGWLHPSSSRRGRHDAVAMVTAVAQQPRIEHLAVGRLQAERVIRF